MFKDGSNESKGLDKNTHIRKRIEQLFYISISEKEYEAAANAEVLKEVKENKEMLEAIAVSFGHVLPILKDTHVHDAVKVQLLRKACMCAACRGDVHNCANVLTLLDKTQRTRLKKLLLDFVKTEEYREEVANTLEEAFNLIKKPKKEAAILPPPPSSFLPRIVDRKGRKRLAPIVEEDVVEEKVAEKKEELKLPKI